MLCKQNKKKKKKKGVVNFFFSLTLYLQGIQDFFFLFDLCWVVGVFVVRFMFFLTFYGFTFILPTWEGE